MLGWGPQSRRKGKFWDSLSGVQKKAKFKEVLENRVKDLSSGMQKSDLVSRGGIEAFSVPPCPTGLSSHHRTGDGLSGRALA